MAAKIKVIIQTIMCWIINVFGLRKNIVLEMEPGRCDNTDALFKRMIELGWNTDRKIIIVSFDPDGFDFEYPNVRIIKPALRKCYDSIWKLVISTYEIACAAIIIDCNIQLQKINKKTVHIYTTHGSPIKSVKKYYEIRKDTDYVIIQSEFWRSVVSNELNVTEDKEVCLGYPRNDSLLSCCENIRQMLNCSYSKIVVWYPTFRQHRDVKVFRGIGIPVIHDLDIAMKINEMAAEYDVLLLVKPHPAQNLGNIREVQLSNIRFIYNDFFIKNKISSYEFLSQTDALITDYSSIFTDYIITGKPIALTFEDVEEYSQKPGFAIDTGMLTSCAEMLYTPDDFERFFSNLVNDVDPHKEKREEVMRVMDDFCDANSTDRTISWISELIKE